MIRRCNLLLRVVFLSLVLVLNRLRFSRRFRLPWPVPAGVPLVLIPWLVLATEPSMKGKICFKFIVSPWLERYVIVEIVCLVIKFTVSQIYWV